ncbi:MAG: hypothetical protein J0M10_00660 [Chitinophagales bacterium]|nr:hypothetical protein [Chitinophagales bacterium]
MKKYIPVLLLLLIVLVSCHRGKVTTIRTSDNNNYRQVKYSGTVSFTADSMAIEGISPGGFLVYNNNEDYLEVNSNREGQLSFEMKENGNNLLMDEQGREFIAKAVKDMLLLGVKTR